MARTAGTLILLPMLLAACSVGPNFSPPTPPALPAWNDATQLPGDGKTHVSFTTDPDPNWWNGFRSPTLTSLMRRAIAQNLTVQQAVLRVVVSHQSEITAAAAGLPTLQGTGSYTREQLGAKGILESKGLYTQLGALSALNSPLNRFKPGLGNQLASTGDKLLDQINQPVDLYSYGLNASWELDLFGQVRRSVEQARANTQAQAEAANDAMVMLEGQVAQAYIQLRAAQALAASQIEDIASAKASLDLTRRQEVQGISTQLDVDQAVSQLGSLQSQLPNYEKQRQEAMNQLSVLVGEPPGTLDALLTPPETIPAPPELVGAGLPASLARRRPDIREAEAQLHAAVASVGVAVASFYPDISLKGSAGLRAVDASYLTNWASLFYSAGPSITLPIFQGGKLTANLRMARAQQVGAALSYRGTVLQALGEVENALVAYRTDRDARDRILSTVRPSEEALALSRNSYRYGLSNFLQVLSAERTLVQARQQLIQANMTLGEDVVALYNALGGGWQQTLGTSQAPQIDMSTPFAPGAVDRVAADAAK